jgi:hypothetical protein
VGELVCLPQQSRRLTLVRAADRWAKAPLSVRVVLITDGSRSFAALVLPRMISCMVYKHPSLHLSLWYKLQSIEHRFLHPALLSSSLHRNNSISICLLCDCHFKPSGQRKMALSCKVNPDAFLFKATKGS